MNGLYDVDYRIFIATRDSKIYTIRNGELAANIIELQSPIVNLVRLENKLIVGCMDRFVYCYHIRGKQLFTMQMLDNIMTIVPCLLQRTKNFKGFLIGLGNGEVRLYNDKNMIESQNYQDIIKGLKFGMY